MDGNRHEPPCRVVRHRPMGSTEVGRESSSGRRESPANELQTINRGFLPDGADRTWEVPQVVRPLRTDDERTGDPVDEDTGTLTPRSRLPDIPGDRHGDLRDSVEDVTKSRVFVLCLNTYLPLFCTSKNKHLSFTVPSDTPRPLSRSGRNPARGVGPHKVVLPMSPEVTLIHR